MYGTSNNYGLQHNSRKRAETRILFNYELIRSELDVLIMVTNFKYSKFKGVHDCSKHITIIGVLPTLSMR